MHHDLQLNGGDLTLRPLGEADILPLCLLAQDCLPELQHMSTPPSHPAYYRLALDAPDAMPFAVYVGREVAGTTRYGDIRAAHAGLEIGWTWLHPRWHGSGVNRRMKALLLAHAFEVMGMERVQIKTDILNTRSQRAIEKLGLTREGVLRSHMRRPDGTMRDTVMYAVTRSGWPEVRRRLTV
ncbi:GNAT family N-acetyltransferase [Deinococcus hopiensis]|uniref:Aminoglycoside 6'-N-acetyltransferase n=1 Tax=Deinococcus hopiensis KR-140 TaxID=695939 RepID=A0A1W1V6B2_9DEIO|nr:GNAT family protein [Deinococcus hopiensis]SMB88969.1 aminoglycoside 6'-N-acetyltransferase [Deinococcus hopiensis KR-140]